MAARPEVSKASRPTKAPVKEPCSPRPPSSEMTLASSSGPAGCHSPPARQKKRCVAPSTSTARSSGPSGSGIGGCEREGEAAVGPVAGAGEDGEDAAEGGVVGDGEEVELAAVVVGREAGVLLVGVGGEGGEPGLGAVAQVLLAAGDQRLLEPAADRLAAREAQGLAGQGEEALGVGGAEPLEVLRQRRAVEAVLDRAVGLGVGRAGRGGDLDGGDEAAVLEVEPAVVAPDALLDRGLAAERRAAEAGERARAEVGVVDRAVRGLDDLAVAGALQGRVGRVLGGEQVGLRVQLVGAGQGAGAGHGDGVVVAGAALGGGQIVPAVALEEVRAFDEGEGRAGEDVGDRAGQAAGDRVVLLQRGCRRRRCRAGGRRRCRSSASTAG